MVMYILLIHVGLHLHFASFKDFFPYFKFFVLSYSVSLRYVLLQNPLNWYEWSLDGPLQNEDFVYSQKMLGYTT
jgi:hypothetical protein